MTKYFGFIVIRLIIVIAASMSYPVYAEETEARQQKPALDSEVANDECRQKYIKETLRRIDRGLPRARTGTYFNLRIGSNGEVLAVHVDVPTSLSNDEKAILKRIWYVKLEPFPDCFLGKKSMNFHLIRSPGHMQENMLGRCMTGMPQMYAIMKKYADLEFRLDPSTHEPFLVDTKNGAKKSL